MTAQRSVNLSKQLPYRPLARSKGSILVISLWSLCLLATFAVYLNNGVRQKIMFIRRLDTRDKLCFIAEAGVKKAISIIKEESAKPDNTLRCGYNDYSGALRETSLGSGSFSISYDGGYGFIDEERKININKAEAKVLKNLFMLLLDFDDMKAQELAACIIDWRDTDSELSIPLGSAEDSDYKSLPYPYESKDTSFEVLDELFLVKGIDKDIFEKLKNYITIYGSGKININTASRAVLLSLGLKEDIVDKILMFRAGSDKISGTFDDNIFDESNGIAARLSEVYELNEADMAQIEAAQEQYLCTSSSNFMIKVTARLNNAQASKQIISVADISGKILYWQEL